ncbi:MULTISPECIES: hypothetical protein [unclassified Sulfitobacter]|jgi:hypothetical protein|uniref:hypothetical protein n=1 Tax=unclassified Sulfitobacter TaxID=196795 RepID=UPI001593073A|nr:hypothetical protein [Sulfitobacter sp. HGT1]MBQ0803565.1 hypothetical protein [Sulfitobacter sp.]
MENASTSLFDILIWAGALISLVGFFGLVWCIVTVMRAKRANLPEDDMRLVLQKALPLNLGALFLSVIGLMMVVIGIMLG